MAPVIGQLRKTSGIEATLCVTAQHREMLDQVLGLFQLVPDYDLDIMSPGQDLSDVTATILTKLRDLFKDYKPDRILVHGDTNTCLSASLAQRPVWRIIANCPAHVPPDLAMASSSCARYLTASSMPIVNGHDMMLQSFATP